MFEQLVAGTATEEIVPKLATEWETISDTEWEFKLREGVTFHDGSPFTAEDVAWSVERVREGTGPITFSGFVEAIEEVEIVDDHTIRIHTAEPVPTLLNDLVQVFIVSKEATEGATLEDFDSGPATVGTGPYRFVSYTPGEVVELTAYDEYWGGEPAWDDVTIRTIPDDAAREVALLSGDVDVIEYPSVTSLRKLIDDPDISVTSIDSQAGTYIGFDQEGEAMGVEGTDGENPFLDPRVRQAVSFAIDRQLLVEQALDNTAVPASQPVPKGVFGHSEAVTVDPYDPERARELLAEAGYPDGFRTVLSVADDRVPEARRVGTAVAAMLARVGIETDLQVIPYTVWRPAAKENEYPLFINNYRGSIPDANNSVRALWMTPGYGRSNAGSQNYGRYSNREDVDDPILAAFSEMDSDRRQELVSGAVEAAMEDQAFAYLFWESFFWAARDGVLYEARRDRRTAAPFARPAD
jgi:peptide/nickel transport system substrate-binding protein